MAQRHKSAATSSAWLLFFGVALLPLQCLPAAAQAAPDIFAEGDVLKINAYGREDLTGQYSVQPGPVLSLPLIGTVKLENHSARQLETELAAAWENRLGSPMSVTVEFALRAPFYVLGDVKAPGSYPYRPGLTPLQAIAVSGGILRPEAGGASVRIDLIRERERRGQAIEKLAAASVRKARLEAERDGRSVLTLDPPFTLASKTRMDQLIAEENNLLDARSKRDQLREMLLSEQLRLSEAELGSYQRQFDAMDAQQKQIAKEASRIRKLPGQQVRAFELDQRVTSLETTKASLKASITHAKVGVVTARNGIADLAAERQSDIANGLLEAENVIRENELVVAATQDVLAGSEAAAPAPTLVLKLMRAGSAGFIPVESTGDVHPGDVLEVAVSAPGSLRTADTK